MPTPIRRSQLPPAKPLGPRLPTRQMPIVGPGARPAAPPLRVSPVLASSKRSPRSTARLRPPGTLASSESREIPGAGFQRPRSSGDLSALARTGVKRGSRGEPSTDRLPLLQFETVPAHGRARGPRPSERVSMPRPTLAGSERMQRLARLGRLRPPRSRTLIDKTETSLPPMYLPPVGE